MTYNEARVYLDEVSKYGSVLGLDTIRALLDELGNPQEDLRFIHIAGTNGKGSVLAYISTILSEAGYRIGRYVSPTVVSYLERIQIDSQWIPKEDFAELVELAQKAIAKMETKGLGSPTVFEVETAIAFLYFRKCSCDFVVLETGLGGVLDATNIVKNTEIAAFASISMDHMGFLGNTLTEIAENKAGIIKAGCEVVTNAQKPEAMEVLQKKADELGCQLNAIDLSKAKYLKESWEGQRFSYGDEIFQIQMAGRYQMENALTAYEAIQALRRRGYHISNEAVENGFAKTKWIGRFSWIRKEPLFIVDGAHNADAAIRLRESVEELLPNRRFIGIMGVFKDKEYEQIVETMAPLFEKIYTVNLPDTGRTLDAETLKQTIENCCKDMSEAEVQERTVTAVGDIEKAVNLALDEAGEDDAILAFGSLSYLGRVIEQNAKRM